MHTLYRDQELIERYRLYEKTTDSLWDSMNRGVSLFHATGGSRSIIWSNGVGERAHTDYLVASMEGHPSEVCRGW